MIGSGGLTPAYGDKFERSAKGTVPGMAHFAGTGPEGTTFRECEFWKSKKYKRSGGVLNARRCRKYPRLSQGVHGAGVPHSTASCRWFEASSNPPVADLTALACQSGGTGL